MIMSSNRAASVLAALTIGGAARAQVSAAPAAKSPPVATAHAAGTFEVNVAPLSAVDSAGAATLGRYSLDKQYHGDLQGTAKGQMLTAGTAVAGSGAYVAVERVTGTLNGRSGTFTLQHSGTMAHGAYHLTITVVPDSGTGQLSGIAGTMTITIAADGTHSYTFDYTLPTASP